MSNQSKRSKPTKGQERNPFSENVRDNITQDLDDDPYEKLEMPLITLNKKKKRVNSDVITPVASDDGLIQLSQRPLDYISDKDEIVSVRFPMKFSQLEFLKTLSSNGNNPRWAVLEALIRSYKAVAAYNDITLPVEDDLQS